ncbi:unnamed protein product [Brassica napus]|uniref:(rape) hypothetical protein n=1 Tax=Brassica napus TaxID=3708 RepID=A0A816I7M4_BRANA|nr:unnamed protein product [Brassica napus]
MLCNDSEMNTRWGYNTLPEYISQRCYCNQQLFSTGVSSYSSSSSTTSYSQSWSLIIDVKSDRLSIVIPVNSQTTKWAKKCENGLKQQIADWEALEGREPSQLLSVEDYWTKQRNESGPKKLFLNSKQRKESPRRRCILDNIQGMICDVVFTSKLTDEEAKWIMETAQSFYLNDTRYKLLERNSVPLRERSSFSDDRHNEASTKIKRKSTLVVEYALGMLWLWRECTSSSMYLQNKGHDELIVKAYKISGYEQFVAPRSRCSSSTLLSSDSLWTHITANLHGCSKW